MNAAQIIVLATPVFFILIAVEAFVGWRRGRSVYRLNDALTSVGLGVLSEVVKLFARVWVIGIYGWFVQHVSLWQLDARDPWVWILALIGYDFLYYWQHRAGHRIAVLWAAHVVHHQSEDFNLSTALRQSSSGFLLNWIFYLPLAVLGVPPMVFATVALIDLLYQYWVHTQLIGRLGWFDRWFCAPSNHRVHHAVNERYLDRNFGGILMVWDRWFGTYAEEVATEPCRYGTRAPLRSFNPLWANLQIYRDLVHDSWRARAWGDKLRVWVMPPGWRPADVAARWPRPAFELERFERFDPAVSSRSTVGALLLFVAALGVTAVLLWQAREWPLADRLLVAGLAVALLWACGALLHRPGPLARSGPASAS